MNQPMPKIGSRISILTLSVLSIACEVAGKDAFAALGGTLTLPSVPCTQETDFYLLGFLPADVENLEFKLNVGDSRRMLLIPSTGGSADCRALIRSVEWITEDPKVAGFEAEGVSGSHYAWLTARDAGSTRFGANVTFLDGNVKRAVPDISSRGSDVLRVQSRVPRGERQVVVAGELEIPAASAALRAHAYVQMNLAVRGAVDMRVDWVSVANNVSANLCQGAVAPGFGCAPTAVPGRAQGDRKPIENSAVLPPGVYTLWIASAGPGAERVRYEIGVTPE